MPADSNLPWYKQLNSYHWFVLLVASAAWFFDCLDQRLFSLARVPALTALMDKANADQVQAFGKVVTAWFLIGWGIGGMIFGALGDRYGRARMLTVTILIYSAFTGLSFFSYNEWDFTVCRFLTGLGVGGVFGLAVALIAETVPAGARAQSLGLLQVLSTVGNVTAGFAKMAIDSLEKSGVITMGNGWRWMFLIGALPALLIILTWKRLKEPAPWLKLKEEGRLPKGSIFAPYAGLLSAKRWRKNLLIGSLLACTGVVGLWAIGEYSFDLQTSAFNRHYAPEVVAKIEAAEAGLKQGVPDAVAALKDARDELARVAKPKTEQARNIAYLFYMLGAAGGMWIVTRLSNALGRRPAFILGFTYALVVTLFVYWKMETPTDAYWMMTLMGAGQLGVFAGFAIYLPELFPSRFRSTGTSFCYNLGRFAAAAGSFYSAQLSGVFKQHYGGELPLRYSAMVMCAFFLVGIVTAFFAPETKGQPLPEEDDGLAPAKS